MPFIPNLNKIHLLPKAYLRGKTSRSPVMDSEAEKKLEMIRMKTRLKREREAEKRFLNNAKRRKLYEDVRIHREISDESSK